MEIDVRVENEILEGELIACVKARAKLKIVNALV